MLDREAVGGALAEQHDIGVAHDLAAKGRHQMGQAVIAEILASVAQIVGLRRAGFVDAILDAAADVAAVNRQHRIDVGIARRPHQDRRLIRNRCVIGGHLHSETT